MDCKIDVIDNDDGTDRPIGQPPQLPFDLNSLIDLYTFGPVQSILSQSMSRQSFGGFSFTPVANPAMIPTISTTFPYFQENNKYYLGNLALFRSSISNVNTQKIKFGINIQQIEIEVA